MTRQTLAEWWSVNLYVRDCAALDAVAPLVVPWLGEQAREAGATRWFFIRYVDSRGHHLRLRMRADPAANDDLYGRRHELVELAHARGEGAPAPRILSDPLLPDIASHPAVVSRVYSPEHVKYGGPAGTAIAESLFTWTSSWHAERDLLARPQVPDRAAFGLALAREITRLLPAQQQSPLWHAHLRKWGRRLRGAPALADLPAFLDDLRPRLEPQAQAYAPMAAPMAARIVTAVRELVATSDRIDPVPVLLDYVHMEMNRLGLNPVEELVIGRLVAAENPDRTVLDGPKVRNDDGMEVVA